MHLFGYFNKLVLELISWQFQLCFESIFRPKKAVVDWPQLKMHNSMTKQKKLYFSIQNRKAIFFSATIFLSRDVNKRIIKSSKLIV
jgi:hypothetical protein